MRNLPPLSCVLAVLLLGTLIYFGYQVSTTYLRYSEYKQLREKWYAGNRGPAAADIDQALAEVNTAHERYGGVELAALKAELLLYQAWYYPEQSVAPIREALPLSFEVYRKSEDNEGYAGWQVAWCLGYADLPTRLERWAEEVQVRAPFLRPQLTTAQLSGRLALDDIPGVHTIIDQELAERGTSKETKVVAIGGLLLLGETEEAAKLEPQLSERQWLDSNLLLNLVQLNIETRHFEQARRLLQRVDEQMPDDVDVALLHALVEYALDGLSSAAAQDYLEESLNSTRRPRTFAGGKAWVCAELARITQEESWRNELLRLVAEQPRDYDVQAAHVFLRLAEMAGHVPDGFQEDRFKLVQENVELALCATGLAQTAAQRQEAWLALAQTHVHAVAAVTATGESIAPDSHLEEALASLRRALGDPAVKDCVVTERLPDYGGFLTDRVVREVRDQQPEFDRNVHKIIIDYLNRRIDLFRDLPDLRPMEHLPYADHPAATGLEQPPQVI